MVYVDDFKMDGTPANMARRWADIGKHIELDGAGRLDHCLGCNHVFFDTIVDGHKARGIEYHAVDYVKTCVSSRGFGSGKLRKVDTPFHPLLVGGDPSGRSGNDLLEDAPLWGEKNKTVGSEGMSILMKRLYGHASRDGICLKWCNYSRQESQNDP